MNISFSFVAILIASFSLKLYSQQFNDYIITTKGDTLFGDLRYKGMFNFDEITLNKGNSSQSFHLSELNGYVMNGSKHAIMFRKKKNNEKVYFSSCIAIDGKVKLTGTECDLTDVNYVIFNKVFYVLNRKNLLEKIWPFMLECEEFSKLHKGFSKRWLTKSASKTPPNELAFVIEKYNNLCGR